MNGPCAGTPLPKTGVDGHAQLWFGHEVKEMHRVYDILTKAIKKWDSLTDGDKRRRFKSNKMTLKIGNKILFKGAHVWEAKMRTDGSNIIDIKFL